MLVKEVNWLGDVVISLPALRAVRLAYPDAHLAVLVKRELASFFDGTTWIDEVIPYAVAPGARGLADRRHVIAEIRARRFDVAILLPKSFESALWVRLAQIPRRAGLVGDARGWMLTHTARRVRKTERVHQVHSYLRMLHDTLGIDGSADVCAPDVHPPHLERMRDWLSARRRQPARRLIALAVAAAYGPAKEWPIERYAALIDVLAAGDEAECVLVGSPTERDKCAAAAAASQRGALIAAGETSVGELIALLSLCDGFAGNDSGAMHVAAALGVPTVGIFGSTDPQRTGPLGPKTTVLYREIECSPCLERTCRYGHHNCLKAITSRDVIQALRDIGALA